MLIYQLDFHFSINKYNHTSVEVRNEYLALGSIHSCNLLGFSVHAITKKWIHNPFLNFSVRAKAYQIASVTTPT